MKLSLTLWLCCLLCTACATTSTSQTASSATGDKTKEHQVAPADRYHPFEWAEGEKYTMPPGIPES